MEAQVHETLLVGQPPALLPGLEVAARCRPGTLLEGDFYDFFPRGLHGLDLVMGDVSGVGLPAALIASATRSQLLRVLHQHPDAAPESVVTQVGDAVGGQFLGRKSFETLCYARFDTKAAHLDYVDCGHTPTLHYSDAAQTCTRLRGDNMPLGIAQTEQYRALTQPFAPGDLFLFYSEGVTTARNDADAVYGVERLQAFLTQNATETPTALLTALEQDVLAFAAGGSLPGSLTTIAVQIER